MLISCSGNYYFFSLLVLSKFRDCSSWCYIIVLFFSSLCHPVKKKAKYSCPHPTILPTHLIPGVPKKSGTFDFFFFTLKYFIFWFHQLKHCLLKRMIPRSYGLVQYSIDSMTISWNTVIYEFCLKIYLRKLFTEGTAVHKFSLCFVRTDQWASGQQCMKVRKAIIPDSDWIVTRMKRKVTLTMFWCSKLKWYALFSNIKVMQIKCSAFLGHPV